ncbi:hypothetical protein BVRB_6g146730 [Beta vulgaris subsp. vulgaris]|nr:hypothetical protein BVRB_6g146730 [Beta vulgaris subsp. vulgaris]
MFLLANNSLLLFNNSVSLSTNIVVDNCSKIRNC